MNWRFAFLAFVFLTQAIVMALSIAPRSLGDVALAFGCGGGIPFSAVFAAMLFRKNIFVVCLATTTMAIVIIALTTQQMPGIGNPISILLIYMTVVLALSVTLPSSLVHRIGRCPQCGYILGSLAAGSPGCPECGWNRPENEGREPSK